MRDSTHVFVEDPKPVARAGEVGASEILTAERKDIEVLKAGYTRFGRSIFFAAELLTGADAKSFLVLDDLGFAKDKAHVYCKQYRTTFDAATFEFWPRLETACGVNSRYVKDKTGVYLIANCDPESMQVLPEVDRTSFVAVGKPGCALDIHGSYRCGVLLKSLNRKALCGLRK